MSWLSALLQSLPFANVPMLLWGLAAGLPIIIHLLSRRKYNRAPWAAMEFLLAALKKNARRIRIEQLLLLAIRVAILVLLAVALADPVFSLFPTLGSSLGTGGRSHWILVLDGSYSMAYQVDDRSRFDAARDLARQIVQDSQQGDGFSLVLMGDPPRAAIAETAFATGDVLEEIDALRLQHGGASLAPTLSQIERMIRQTADQHPRLTETKICLFTDLGRTTWDDVADEDCRQMLGRLGEDATLLLFDVGQQETRNVGLTALRLRDPLITVGREVTIEAEVQNFGPQDQAGRQLVFLVDEQRVDSDDLDLPAGGRSTRTFAYTFQTPGEHQIEARLDDDALPVDDRRWLSVPVRDTIDVLCIEGRPDAARFVAYALQPGDSARSRIQAHVRLESALLEEDLAEYDCVFLCNVSRFSREEAQVLDAYVREGGGLVVALGDQVQAENYNQRLGASSAGTSLLPARLDGVVADGQHFFDPLQYRHPIVAPFADHERSGLLTTPVWRYVRVEPGTAAATRVALAFQNGDPAIVEQPFQRGRTILVTTALSPESLDRATDPPTPWTALPGWPSFPPLVQEMLVLAIQQPSDARNLLVGEPIEGIVRGVRGDVPLTIRLPDGTTHRVQMQPGDEISSWIYSDTVHSGIYAARYESPLDQTQRYAVNVNTRESDLERFDAELLPSQFEQELGVDKPTVVLPTTRPTQYFRYFLGVVVLLLLAETYVAWRFGSAAA
jgi:hypothetical protein